ncbi:type II toxin-antitoxin system HipA family toxin [Comamonas thiooxydans]|uniref:type II toxin-antitoxin system HipA family toxin n=1 Tax=Comamonas thiooxydans TaxID=363952 RepID=UPI000B40A0AB|nr:HipA domain-containing protein [Comamonas thiooxydans]
MADQFLNVWLDDRSFWPAGVETPPCIGRLLFDGRHCKFTFNPEWLKHDTAFKLDPELALARDRAYTPAMNSYFGFFTDSCPDRWGQELMRRRENTNAKGEGRKPAKLYEWDFFLGVEDYGRMGALRFSASTGSRAWEAWSPGACLANSTLKAPPVASLNQLAEIAKGLTDHKDPEQAVLQEWLRAIVAPGSSLGGARPKANIENAGELWIAKFPSNQDSWDVARRELLIHRLAQAYGITVAPAKVVDLSPQSGFGTFLTKRFDRIGQHRVAFISAMAELQRRDGVIPEQDPPSYIQLLDVLQSRGITEHENPSLMRDAQNKELFRRVLFNWRVHNRDDHLRNHGFIQTPDGVHLAPAYDMNTSLEKDSHAICLTESDYAPGHTELLATAGYYGVSSKEAHAMIDQLESVIATWRDVAAQPGVGLGSRDVDALAAVLD